jgi:hypothetical protein
MANDSQFKFPSRVVATRGVVEYRATIDSIVQASDVVLELGCEWGTTTVLLAKRCSLVVGTDFSSVCIDRARASHPELLFEVLDAFDARAALDLGVDFTKVYIDLSGISGYRSLLDAISLVSMYAAVLRPDTIVIKSGALKHFASRCMPWRPS